MTKHALTWEWITDRRQARGLQAFTCTSDCPRTPGGKRLPHPKRWEQEVQSHLRQMAVRLKHGELLLVGRSERGEVLAAAHLQLDHTAALLQAYIASIAVGVGLRGQGGAIADQALALVKLKAREMAKELGLNTVIIRGKIHTRNRPSEFLFSRAGFEPLSVPTELYQTWESTVFL